MVDMVSLGRSGEGLRGPGWGVWVFSNVRAARCGCQEGLCHVPVFQPELGEDDRGLEDTGCDQRRAEGGAGEDGSDAHA